MAGFRYVIFDMDGLILDSERMYTVAWRDVAKKWGIPLTETMIRETIGMNITSSRAYFLEKFGPDFPYDPFHDEVRERTYALIEEENVPLKPYAEEALRTLRDAGFTLALATGTREFVSRKYLDYHGLMPYFTRSCFGEEVKRGKPAPDAFLQTAEKLGADPIDCAVLEDSTNGILAAKAAGMTALWVPDLVGPEERPDIAARADGIFESLRQAVEWIMKESGK